MAETICREAISQLQEARKLLSNERTWFAPDDEGPHEFSYSSREYGSVGDEEPGEEDIREARRLAALVRSAFDSLKITVDVIDEWVSITVRAASKSL